MTWEKLLIADQANWSDVHENLILDGSIEQNEWIIKQNSINYSISSIEIVS